MRKEGDMVVFLFQLSADQDCSVSGPGRREQGLSQELQDSLLHLRSPAVTQRPAMRFFPLACPPHYPIPTDLCTKR